LLDGVFLQKERKQKFFATPPPTDEEVAALVSKISQRVHRLLEPEQELSQDPGDPLLSQCGSASIQNLVALGNRAGQRVRKIGIDESIGNIYRVGNRCAVSNGFSLHANVEISAHARKKIEKLCRYIARPPIAQERLSQRHDGKLLYKLKNTYSDGTTHVLFEPLELIEKIVAIIPPPRANLLRYHGVLAPNSKLRDKITPTKQTKKTTKQRSKNYSWSNLLKRVFDIDVLTCPKCGSKMKLISTLIDGTVLKPFLKCLNEPQEPPTPYGARAPPNEAIDLEFQQISPESEDFF